MNKQKLKQLLLFGLAIGSAKVEAAGCYPLIPGLFGALLLAETNRTLLLIFTLFGMALFLPVTAMAIMAAHIPRTRMAMRGAMITGSRPLSKGFQPLAARTTSARSMKARRC